MTPKQRAGKWCVTLGGDGWGYYVHPFQGEDDLNANTDTYATFREAKRECLSYYESHLAETKRAIANVRQLKVRDFKARSSREGKEGV